MKGKRWTAEEISFLQENWKQPLEDTSLGIANKQRRCCYELEARIEGRAPGV